MENFILKSSMNFTNILNCIEGNLPISEDQFKNIKKKFKKRPSPFSPTQFFCLIENTNKNLDICILSKLGNKIDEERVPYTLLNQKTYFFDGDIFYFNRKK
mgnify:FL=1